MKKRAGRKAGGVECEFSLNYDEINGNLVLMVVFPPMMGI